MALHIMLKYYIIHGLFTILAAIINQPVFWAIYIAMSTYMLLYNIHKIEQELKADVKKQKTNIIESGSAIADTLKVAFDNLKRNTSDHNKINSTLTEYNSRIHRLEQNHNRLVKDKHSQVKINDNIKNENE